MPPTFAIYDSDNDALARPFLLKRFESADKAANSSSLPGGPSRWKLPQDSSGQNDRWMTEYDTTSVQRMEIWVTVTVTMAPVVLIRSIMVTAGL